MFEQKKLRPRRRPKPLWLMLVLSGLMPGLGHLVLGKLRCGLLVLGGTIGAGMLCGAAFGLDWMYLWWLGGRLGVLLAVFALTDSAMLVIEAGDGRLIENRDRPRVSGILNLLFYGVGYFRQDERGLAIIGLLTGLLTHVLMGSQHWAFALLGEVVALGLGWHAWMRAQEPRRTRQLQIGERVEAGPVNSTPSWLVPSMASVAVLLLLMTAGAAGLYRSLSDAVRVRQDRAVVMEPYYRNPAYGLSLEMNAPGWTFGTPADNEFVVARHVSEDALVRMSIQPRFPGMSHEDAAFMVIMAAEGLGYHLTATRGSTCRFGSMPGYRLEAEGSQGNRPRRVLIATAGKGFRQYVLWMEWNPQRDAFARQEADHLLSSLAVEG